MQPIDATIDWSERYHHYELVSNLSRFQYWALLNSYLSGQQITSVKWNNAYWLTVVMKLFSSGWFDSSNGTVCFVDVFAELKNGLMVHWQNSLHISHQHRKAGRRHSWSCVGTWIGIDITNRRTYSSVICTMITRDMYYLPMMEKHSLNSNEIGLLSIFSNSTFTSARETKRHLWLECLIDGQISRHQ